MSKKFYSNEFKKAIVELNKIGGRSIGYLHREYLIPKATIYNWIKASNFKFPMELM